MLPVTEHPSWQIIDSSKLDDYLDCERRYFFANILGWRLDMPNHDMYFGECWHRAREYMLTNGYNDMLGAYNAFLDHYRLEYDEDTDDMYIPKTPEAVLLAIPKFASYYSRDLIENELLYTEISGSVPIDDHRVIYFRMDSVLRSKEDGKIFSWDHKSGKKFNRNWSSKFYLSIQNGTYTHCLYCMYPIDQVKGVEFCGTAFEFLKRGSRERPAGYHINFERVPAWRTQAQMSNWLWTVIDRVDNIERDLDRLSHCSESDPVMQAFPMNPNNCTKYWGCIYHDFCMAWDNPLRHCFEPPPGFKQEFWDPRDMETTNKMQLEWKE